MRVFGSFGRSLSPADAALCVVAYVRPANIDDDALHTHRYRSIDVKAGSRNLKQSIWRIIHDAVLLELSFNCSKNLHSIMELRIQPLGPKAAQSLCPTPQSETLNACEVRELLCSCQRVVTLGSSLNISKREMYLINSNIPEVSGTGFLRGRPLHIEKTCGNDTINGTSEQTSDVGVEEPLLFVPNCRTV